MTTISTIFATVANYLFLYKYRYWLYDMEIGIWKIILSFSLMYCGGPINKELFINNQLWYISVLIICYIIFFIILWLEKNKNFKSLYSYIIMIIIGISIKEYGVNLPFLNDNVSNGYISFFLGTIICKMYNNCKNKKYIVYPSFAILMICFVLGFVNFDIFFDNTYYILSFIIYPSILIITIYLNKWLTCDLYINLGEISFEIYIWHDVFITFLLIFNLSNPNIYEIPYIIFVIIFSILVYKYIEKPINERIKRIINEN